MFYVYEWFINDTLEVFYVGTGTGKRRFETHNRNRWFNNIFNKYDCSVRVVHSYLTNNEACRLESERIAYWKAKGKAKCNFTNGGTGFSTGKLNPIHKRIKHGEENYFSKHKFTGKNNHMTGKKHTEATKKKISQSRVGKGGQKGKDNPMYGNGFRGKDNPMYGLRGLKHHNSKCYKIIYTDGIIDYMHSKGCEMKFGIAFTRIRHTGGILTYKKKSKNDIYTGTIIELSQNV